MKRSLILLITVLFSTAMFAQSHHAGNDSNNVKPSSKDSYVCPMHPSVKSKMPGTCSICGTQFVVSRVGSKQTQKTTFICPMHPDVVASVAGKCPKCGNTFVVKKDSGNYKRKI